MKFKIKLQTFSLLLLVTLLFSFPSYGAENGVNDFVNRLYTLVLNRPADEDGLKDWSEQLITGTNSGAGVAEGFFFSDEFIAMQLSDEEFIDTLYHVFLNRNSDSEGLANWEEALDNGLSRKYVCQGFAGSDEFANLCAEDGISAGTIELTEPRDQNAKITAFVSRCYHTFLGRSADIEGLNQWTSQLLAETKTPKELAYGFIFSPEFIGQDLSDNIYIERLYQGLFNREAADFEVSDWVHRLDTTLSRNSIFIGFADSDEFRNLADSFSLPSDWAGTDDFILRYGISKDTTQVLLIESSGVTAKESMWELQGFEWKKIMETKGYVGIDGVGEASEYISKTPKGVYSLTIAFGVLPNPGTALPYTQINDSHFWVSDVDSAYYNQFVSSDLITPDWDTSEHLTDEPAAYGYAIAIDYNTECIPGKGSAFAFHCETGGPTAGCVSAPKEDVLFVLQHINTHCEIVIQ